MVSHSCGQLSSPYRTSRKPGYGFLWKRQETQGVFLTPCRFNSSNYYRKELPGKPQGSVVRTWCHALLCCCLGWLCSHTQCPTPSAPRPVSPTESTASFHLCSMAREQLYAALRSHRCPCNLGLKNSGGCGNAHL